MKFYITSDISRKKCSVYWSIDLKNQH